MWIVIVWLGACARPVVPMGPSQLAAADAALLRGCHACLIEARAMYLRLASVGAGVPLRLRVLEADLLIATREKELGVPASGVVDEARQIAAALPSRLEADRYIAVLDAIPDHALGMSARELREFTQGHASVAGARAWLARGPLREPVRMYLRRALDCAYEAGDGEAPRRATGDPDPGAPLLLRYRDAICEADAVPALASLRASEPRFVEVALFLAAARALVEIAGEDPELADGVTTLRAYLDARTGGGPR